MPRFANIIVHCIILYGSTIPLYYARTCTEFDHVPKLMVSLVWRRTAARDIAMYTQVIADGERYKKDNVPVHQSPQCI